MHTAKQAHTVRGLSSLHATDAKLFAPQMQTARATDAKLFAPQMLNCAALFHRCKLLVPQMQTVHATDAKLFAPQMQTGRATDAKRSHHRCTATLLLLAIPLHSIRSPQNWLPSAHQLVRQLLSSASSSSSPLAIVLWGGGGGGPLIGS